MVRRSYMYMYIHVGDGHYWVVRMMAIDSWK